MRWIAICLLILTLTAPASARENQPDPQTRWRQEVSRALTGANGRPELKVVRTNKKQVLLVNFRIDPTGKTQAVQVKNVRDSTYQARTAVKRVFSEIIFPIPPAQSRTNKFTVPIVIDSEMTREEMIELLEKRSKALADMAEKLKRKQ